MNVCTIMKEFRKHIQDELSTRASPTDMAKKVRVSRDTVYKAKTHLESGEGPRDQKRGPKVGNHRPVIIDDLMKKIEEKLGDNCTISTKTLVANLYTSYSCVVRVLKEISYTSYKMNIMPLIT